MKKILILTNNDQGFVSFRKEVVEAFVQEGYDLHISVPDTGYIDKLKELGMTVYPASVDRRGMNPIKDLKLLNQYRELIKKVNPDVVLTYTIKPNIYGGVACRICKKPYIVNVTGLGTAFEKKGIFKMLVKQMYRTGIKGASCVFFQNQDNETYMEENGGIPKGVHHRLLMGSGVNIEAHPYLPYPLENEEKIHLLYVGRVVEIKGSTELLEAAERVHSKHPEVVFDIVGALEEDARDKYEPWINRLSELGAVEYHGVRDDVERFYGNCQALVHPSHTEGMSNVSLEAGASGRPLITSDIPGCKETHEHGKGGYIFHCGDVDELVDDIETFLASSYEEKKKMGMAAREFVVAKFDRRLVIEAYLEEIRRV